MSSPRRKAEKAFDKEELEARRNSRRLAIRVLSIIALAILTVVAVMILTRTRKHEATSQTQRPLTWWEPIPAHSPVFGVQPILPPVPPSLETDEALFEKFKFILENDPDTDVSHGILKANNDGNLKIRFQNVTRVQASLFAEPREIPGKTDDELGRRPYVAVLEMRIDLVQSLVTPQSMLGMMSVVGHEYQHFLQWKASPPEQWSEFFSHAPGVQLQPDSCRRQFAGELVGYQYECRHYHSWRIQYWDLELQHLCEAVETPTAFAQRLFGYLYGFSTLNEECIPYWAEVAGHPHPEVYSVKP